MSIIVNDPDIIVTPQADGPDIVFTPSLPTPGPQGPQGPVGPPGPPGGSAAPPLQHNQTTPAATWIVNHNLGYYPIVEIIEGGANVLPDVVHSSINSYSVIFAVPATGIALSR